MKKLNLNTILLLTLIGLVALFLFRNNPEPQDPNTPIYQQKIEEQKTIISNLYDSIDFQNYIVDSLKALKKQKDTIYLTILSSLQQLSLTEQGYVLTDNLNASCELKISPVWYAYKGDTLLALPYTGLLCINETFVERDMYLDELGITEQILEETEKTVMFMDSIIFAQDTIINYKDSIIDEHEIVVDDLESKLKRQKWYTRGAIGAAIGILILK